MSERLPPLEALQSEYPNAFLSARRSGKVWALNEWAKKLVEQGEHVHTLESKNGVAVERCLNKGAIDCPYYKKEEA